MIYVRASRACNLCSDYFPFPPRLHLSSRSSSLHLHTALPIGTLMITRFQFALVKIYNLTDDFTIPCVSKPPPFIQFLLYFVINVYINQLFSCFFLGLFIFTFFFLSFRSSFNRKVKRREKQRNVWTINFSLLSIVLCVFLSHEKSWAGKAKTFAVFFLLCWSGSAQVLRNILCQHHFALSSHFCRP